MPNLEFHVSEEGSRAAGSTNTKIFASFDKAAGHAVALSVARGAPMVIDVVTWTRAAARKWGGDDAVEVFDDDPDASVHERVVVRADAQGKVA